MVTFFHLKTKFSQSFTDSIRLQGPSKRPSSGLLYPVSSVKEHDRKGGKYKISVVLHLPVSSTQASSKVEASNSYKQAQHFPTCRKVQNGNTVNLVHSVNCLVSESKIKNVKGASCVNQCLSAQHAQSVPNAVPNLAVGGRLQKYWQKWQNLGANPRVVSILQEGYTLPFKIRPPLTRSPLIKSGYAHPVKSRFLKEALLDLINKLVVERVVDRSSLALYNRLFLVPKPNKRWKPILDLSKLNLFLQLGTFKMETPETIRLSLQKGEWVTCLDFSDAYFHIPINQRSGSS